MKTTTPISDNRPDLRTVYKLPENPPEIQKAIDKSMAELARAERQDAPVLVDMVWFFGGAGMITLGLLDHSSYHLIVLGAAMMGLSGLGRPIDD